jgi:hypothetical protein
MGVQEREEQIPSPGTGVSRRLMISGGLDHLIPRRICIHEQRLTLIDPGMIETAVTIDFYIPINP